MNDILFERVKDYVEAKRDTVVELLTSLCRIPSVSKSGSDGFPFGKDVDDVLCAVGDVAGKCGIPCRVENDKGYAVTKIGAGDKTIGMFSHCDVVPANADEWTKTSPFKPYIDGKYIYGRGVSDNKSAAAACLCISQMIKDGVLPIKSSFLCYFGGSEETGMEDLDNFIQNETLPDISLVPDIGFPVCVGEKGILRINVYPSRNFEKIVDFNGGIAVNAVIGTLTVKFVYDEELFEELHSKTKDSNLYSLDSDEKTITLTVFGVTSHAAYPENARNAAVTAAKILAECTCLGENDRYIMKMLAETADGHYGEKVCIASDDEKFGKNTFVLGLCRCDEQHPCFSFDIRFGRELSCEEIYERLAGVFSKYGCSVESVSPKKCYETEVEQIYIDTVLDAYREYTGNASAVPFCSPGGTYSRKLGRALGTDIKDFNGIECSPHGLPSGHGEAHQPDECLFLDAYFRGIALTAMLIYELDAKLYE